MLATGEFAMKATSIGLMLGAAVLAAGCASQAPQPTSMRDPQADFAAYETFALKYGPSGDASSQSVSVVEGYIRTAITAELKGKGYVEAAAGTEPDLRIEYEAASEKKLKNNPFRIGVGVGGYGSNVGGGVGVGSPSVKNVTEGTLVIHAVDPVRKAEVWQGRASRELGKGNIEPAVVQAGVAELLRDFPARSGKP
jgi:opacity protein-like surface antigen